MLTGYLAPLGQTEHLLRELKDVLYQYDRLFIAEGPPQNVKWVQNIWFDVERIPFTSISDGAKKLRSKQKLWSFYPYQNVRRGELIREGLPYFSPKPFPFPTPLPKTALGSWTLVDANTLLASSSCSSPFAQGEVHFQESKIPPSRAYLKLWEALTHIGKVPKTNEMCLEVGASPGSWTWALQQLGALVVAVDRAELDGSLATLPGVTFVKRDAFSIQPKEFPELNWLFSDVICYPKKLLEWIKPWLDLNVNIVCTLKFQGEQDYEIIQEWEKIEGSHLIHLYHNKHELTWYRMRK